MIYANGRIRSRKQPASVITFGMGPSNEHELTIARVVDRLCISGRLYASLGDLIVGVLPFSLAKIDEAFLVDYIR